MLIIGPSVRKDLPLQKHALSLGHLISEFLKEVKANMTSYLSTRANHDTFRISECDLFAPPQAKIGSLELLRHQSIELQSGAKPCANLRKF